MREDAEGFEGRFVIDADVTEIDAFGPGTEDKVEKMGVAVNGNLSNVISIVIFSLGEYFGDIDLILGNNSASCALMNELAKRFGYEVKKK